MQLLEALALNDNISLLQEPPQRSYDQPRIRAALLREARKIAGPKVLVSLDADECLAATALNKTAWREVMSAPKGTFVSLPWFQLLPGAERGWFAERVLAGFVDDGRAPDAEHELHEPRFPGSPDSILELDGLAVLHYQTAEPRRWHSKQRWYQCLERVTYPHRRPAELYRQYHERDPEVRSDIVAVPPHFLRGYEECGIDMRSVIEERTYRWDGEVLEMFARYGPTFFRRVDVWDADWHALARDHATTSPVVVDPRSALDRAVFRWLKFAQPRRQWLVVRAISRALRLVGW